MKYRFVLIKDIMDCTGLGRNTIRKYVLEIWPLAFNDKKIRFKMDSLEVCYLIKYLKNKGLLK